MEVEAINLSGAKVGDTVVVGFETGPLLKVSLLIYIFPIFFMIFGAIMGQKVSKIFGVDESAIAAIGAFLFFGAAFVIVRAVGKRLSVKEAYRAKVIQITKV